MKIILLTTHTILYLGICRLFGVLSSYTIRDTVTMDSWSAMPTSFVITLPTHVRILLPIYTSPSPLHLVSLPSPLPSSSSLSLSFFGCGPSVFCVSQAPCWPPSRSCQIDITDRQTDRKTDRQTDRTLYRHYRQYTAQTDGQTCRQTGRQTALLT